MPATRSTARPPSPATAPRAAVPTEASQPKRRRSWGTVSRKDVLLFTKSIVVLLHAGSTVLESITVLRDQAKGHWRDVLTDIRDHVERGFPLGDALRHEPKAFSSIYVSIVEIGERSGTLEGNLKYLAMQLAKQDAIRRQVLGAMTYPIIVMSGTLLLGAAVVIFVLPKLTRLFQSFDVALPLSTRILLGIATFTSAHGSWAIPTFFGGLVFCVWALRRPAVRPITHRLILRLPVVGAISRHVNLALFCRTLSVLLRTGTTIDDGLAACAATVPNVRYAVFLRTTYEQVKGGSTLADSLRQQPRLFAPTDVQILQVGENSGTLMDSLDYCAEYHEENVQTITKSLATILEPFILLILGGMVATLALSIITPIYSITQQFRR
ncbi:MAG: type II secretion system F family protein [bacterium]|nr:type II secretion system F family protein [bacterium]